MAEREGLLGAARLASAATSYHRALKPTLAAYTACMSPN
jgi:hypothetical protein